MTDIATKEMQSGDGQRSASPGPAANGAGANGFGDNRSDAARPPERKKSRLPFLLILVAVIAVIAVLGVRWYRYNSTHVSTDDAQIGGDIYSISAQVSGYLTEIPVSTNQMVHKGDLLARIDPREYQAALEQAEANLMALRATAAASGTQVSVTRQTAGAGMTQASAGVSAAAANVAAAQSRVNTTLAGVSAARASLTSAIAGEQSSRHAIAAAAAQVRTAQSQLKSAQAAVVAAQANESRVAADARRYENLYHEGAISAQQYDLSVANLSSAHAATLQAQDAVSEAQARVSQDQAAEASAQSAASQAAAAVQQARVGVLQAQDQVEQANAAVSQARAQYGQAAAALTGARSAPAQVAVTASNAASNNAKIAQAEAAVDQAKLQLSYCVIYAPADGYVSEKNAEPGQLVQPGQALMAVVPLTGTYVDANFKETQLDHIRVGQPAELTVDAYPGKTLHGTVRSISSATGATFSLLPPENATGNFVKVVQRVPVRVSINSGEDPQHLLRLGMSANVTIDVGR